ncbi:MAG: LysE family translocator [Paracoccaceae bacterium]
MLSFAAAVFLLIITPGPGVLSTAGVGSAYGFRFGLRYVLGLFIGTNLVSLAVISGLAAIVLGIPAVRTVLLVASAAYLLYLAGRIAFAGSRIAFIEAKTAPGATAGILLQLINPKAYAVNTTLFTGFAFYPDSLAVETAVKLLILNAIWIPIHLAWLYAGVALKRLELAAHHQFRINVIMALSMLAVVALALLSGFNGETP